MIVYLPPRTPPAEELASRCAPSRTAPPSRAPPTTCPRAGLGAQVLADLGPHRIKLTNNPRKIAGPPASGSKSRTASPRHRSQLMGARRSPDREAALQMLFQLEASGERAPRAIELFWRSFEADPEDAPTPTDRERTRDAPRRRRQADHRRLEQLAARAHEPRRPQPARMSTWELLAKKDVPRAVVIDEGGGAREVLRHRGLESAFVNGVLDRIANDLGRQDEK